MHDRPGVAKHCPPDVHVPLGQSENDVVQAEPADRLERLHCPLRHWGCLHAGTEPL